MNGFPNGFYGWGGEDDELAQRTNQTQLTITRQAGNIARYTMLKHDGVCNNIVTNHPKNEKIWQNKTSIQLSKFFTH